MSLKVRNYNVVVGLSIDSRPQQAANEDVQHVFAFVDAPSPLGSGAPIDLTDMTTIKLTVKDANGTQLFQQAGVVVGLPTAGKAGFTVLHGVVGGGAAQPYTADVLLVDSTGKQNQLVYTPFQVTPGIT